MRTEYEILELVKKIAGEDSRINAAALCGSRADKSVPRDVYQDYDILLCVSELAPFKNNLGWLEENFGRTLIVQLPDEMELFEEPARNDRYAYLAIFEDGVRIDLTLATDACNIGEAFEVILDKTGVLSKAHFSESRYNVSRPDQKKFSDCCNEFWWCVNNVAKGLAREQIPYAKAMFECNLRPMLNNILCWYIGSITDFSVNVGKYGKHLKTYLPDSIYEKYLKTYCAPDVSRMWACLIDTCKLFSDMARLVADELGVEYNTSEEDGMRIYLMNVKNRVYERR